MTEPVASSIILTPGTSPGPAPAGKHRLYQRTDGVMVRIDEAGTETIVGRDGTQIPSFGELSDVDLTDVSDDQTIKLVNGLWVPTDLVAGPTGASPEFEWFDTSIRFKNPDGTWGAYTNLEGPIGASGEDGDAPEHEWSGTYIRFRDPDGTWGVYTDVQGTQGVQGDVGDTPAHEWQNQFELRFQNPDGTWGTWTNIRGEAGTDGTNGTDGTDGTDGEAPEHEWSNTELRFKRPDGNWGAYTDLKGDQGDQGIQGEEGNVTLSNVFFSKNLVTQSLSNQSSIDLEWDSRILMNSTLFTHSQSDNPSEITVNFNGYVDVSFKLVFLNQDSDRDILINGELSKNNSEWFDEMQAFAYTRYRSYGHIACIVLPPTPLEVFIGDVLRVHSEASKDTSFGDRLDVSTVYGQSTLRLQAYPEV